MSTVHGLPEHGNRELLPDSISDMHWKAMGRCHGVLPKQANGPDIFYPEVPVSKATGVKAGQIMDEMIALATSICNECPVKTKCFEYATLRGEEWGVFGGVFFGAGRRKKKTAVTS